MSRWLSLVLLFAVIIGVAAVFVRVMAEFLLPLFLAAILVVIFRPMHKWMVKRFKGHDRLAGLTTTIVIGLIVLAPMGLIATFAAIEANSLLNRFDNREIRGRISRLRTQLGLEYEYADEIRYLESSLSVMHAEALKGATAQADCDAVQRVGNLVKKLERQLHLDDRHDVNIDELRSALDGLEALCGRPDQIGTLEYQNQLRTAASEFQEFKMRVLDGPVKAWLKEIVNPTSEELRGWTNRVFAGTPGFLRSVGGATTNFLFHSIFGLCILLLAVYFFLVDGPDMLNSLMRLSPLDDEHERELVDEFDRISRAVVIATLLSAVVQGVLAGAGFWMAGISSVFLLTLVTIVFALIPFAGAATVWVPVSLWLYFYEGRPLAAILLALYGGIIISMADNVIKPYVLHGQSNLHPLLALLSVLGGVQVLGPIGILVGPMVVVFLQTLLNILQREMSSMDRKLVK